MPAIAIRLAPQRSAKGPDIMPTPKYRNPANENTSETEPRDAPKSLSNEATNELNVYALPKPTKVTANAAATMSQP